MGRFNSRKKKLIAYAIIVSLQMQTALPIYTAAAEPKANPQIVNIVKPDQNGLSHNKADNFNVDKSGLIFNNITQGNANTVLGGQLSANSNLGGVAAKTILTEVTGSGISNLHGVMEIAGQKANLIIANPNGINVNGAGFINVDRAALVTGRPNFDSGKLGFAVTGGRITVGENGNMPAGNFTNADEANKYLPNKLEIMTRAAAINGELWAKAEINVITGANNIDYETSQAKAISGSEEKSGVALDVAALGGMYAGKITLVGTENGLGMNIKGNLNAQKDMTITNDGKITFVKTGADSESSVVSAGGDLNITATEDMDNCGVVTAQGDATVQLGGNLTNSGVLQAGASYTAEEDEAEPTFITSPATLSVTAKNIINENGGQLTASENLAVSVTENIVNDGYFYSNKKADIAAGGIISGAGSVGAADSVKITADKLTLNKNNIYTFTADGKIDTANGVTIVEKNPDKPTEPENPETEDRKPEKFTNPDVPDIAGTTDPAATVTQDKVSDDSLTLAADINADGKYKPVIDHAANGVDLVQIAQVNGNGISRNLYSDFNIKSGGLILNNATEYVKTELGGYIDRNMFLAGNGARIILNEVTSSRASTLNGYLEVAGHKASVVIANANGISVNGLGFINTDNVTIATGRVTNWADGNMRFSAAKGDMQIAGDGLNARNPKQLDIVADNLTVNSSELYANELHISSDGLLANTGKIAGTKNIVIAAENMRNTAAGFIEAKQNMNIDIKGALEQQQATIKSGADLAVNANSFTNEENSLLSGAEDVTLNINNALTNNKAIILTGNNLDAAAADLTNAGTALINYGQNAALNIANTLTNSHATISGDGAETDTVITATNFINREQSAFVTNGSAKITATGSFTNNNANIYINGDSDITAGVLLNNNTANIHTGGDALLSANTMRNSKASVDVQGSLTAEIGSLTNEDSGVIGTGGSAAFATGSFINRSLGSLYITKAFTNVSTGGFLNEDGLIAIGGSGSISAKNITNQNAAGVKQGSIINAAGDLSLNAGETILNRSSDIESAGNISITAKNLINKKEIFETSFHESHENISYKIPHLQQKNYYDAMREFDRQILTAIIDKETDDANIIASGNMDIILDENLSNLYSKINAGGDLNVKAAEVKNEGYQGTVHYYDRGQDNHYWKYKKHRRFHIGCHWKYGTTVLPYFDHTMYDEEGAASERRSLLGAAGSVTIKADNVINKTYQAQGKVGGLPSNDEYVKFDASNHIIGEVLDVPNKKVDNSKSTYSTDYLAKENIASDVDSKNKNVSDPATNGKMLDISELHINSKIYSLNGDPSAKYLIETNKKFADYHEFLSSDYLLVRVKADPEKITKRLGDGYFEQQLVIDKIAKLTGRPYLGEYGSDMEQFKALMDAGVVAAEEMQLKIGVALTAEQMATLTSDIVWLVEEEVNGQKVLVPEVYLAGVRDEDLTAGGALIVGGEAAIYSKQNIENIGTIRADGSIDLHAQNMVNKGEISGENIGVEADNNLSNSGSIRAKVDTILKGKNITNEATTEESTYQELEQTKITGTGSITAGNNLTLEAEENITDKGGVLAADKELILNAGKNIDIVTTANEKHVAVAYGSSAAEIHRVENRQSVLAGENITINAGENVSVSGGVLSAAKNAEINAGGDVHLTAVKDLYSEESEVGHRGGSNYYHDRTVDETVKGTNIATGENITVNSANDINIKGSNVASEAGKAVLNAENNVNIQNESEYHERLHEKHEKVSGVLSSKTTDVYDYSNINGVVGSNISAGEVEIMSGADTNIKGSSVVADKDVTVQAGGELNAASAEQTSESEYMKQVKKSGLLSGGGLGFTIGKEKQKDEYANQNSEQIGSTIGSLEGSVRLEAGKDANIKGSDVITGKDISIQGENVNIENTDSVYNAQEKHEFKRSGISVSIGGQVIDKVNEAVNHVERATQVEDKRLAALHGYEAYDTINKNIDKIKDAAKDPTRNLSLNVSIGSSKSKSESSSTTVVANESNVKAKGDVNINSTEKDITIKGSNVEGENISLNAKENLNITASKNTNITKQNSKSSSASVGIGFDLATGSLNSISISGSKAKGEVDANSTTYNESSVTANKNLDFTSGADTNIQGGKLAGEKVAGNVGGNLNIESKQDSNSYKEKNTSAGIGIGISVNGKDIPNKTGVFGGASKGEIDSKYDSVTDQSGIYAGKEGFDIRVENNTDLKGGIISSEAEKDKNKISTGTLTFEDIKNKAEYEAGSVGVNVDTSKDAEHNEAGVTPNIGIGAKDDAESTTKATISEGEIEIRDKDKQKQDIAGLNRDTKNSLNRLGEIFDKTKVEERQELAGLFGELAFNQIHYMNGTAEQKALYHALVGGIMSKLTSGNFLAGASATAINKLVIKEIEKIAGKDPAMMQWLSAAVGGVISELVSKNTEAGAGAASSGTKNNDVLLRPDELAELVFANGRAEELCKAQGIPVTKENMSEIKETFTEFVEEYNESDAIMFNLSTGMVDNSIIYDLNTDSLYLSSGDSVSAGLPIGASFAAIKIISNDPNINLEDPDVRKEILSGISVSSSAYMIAGLGLSLPIGSKYDNRVSLMIKGVGTPQIGIGVSQSETSQDRVDRIQDSILDNKYGSD